MILIDLAALSAIAWTTTASTLPDAYKLCNEYTVNNDDKLTVLYRSAQTDKVDC